MGLGMKSGRKVCGQIYRPYQKAGKKGRGKILDGYAQTLGMNRDYLAHKLTNRGGMRYGIVNGKAAKEPLKGRRKAAGGKKRGRPEKYDKGFVKVLEAVWDFFDFQCGKLLAPLIRGIISFLAGKFELDEKTQVLLITASPSTIGRKLKNKKKRYRRKGIRTTKPGSLVKSQIPIRACFDRDERSPGFFELDTVSHCGFGSKGQFCQALTVTDVGSVPGLN